MQIPHEVERVARQRAHYIEALIDEPGVESFPASDPPLSILNPGRSRRTWRRVSSRREQHHRYVAAGGITQAGNCSAFTATPTRPVGLRLRITIVR
jgi:hypothetical protein